MLMNIIAWGPQVILNEYENRVYFYVTICLLFIYRFTTYQDARRVRLVDGLEYLKTNILRVSPVKLFLQPDTDLCKIVILTQNINNMLLIVVPSGIRTMVKLTMYLVSLAPRANNYLIQIIAENNFAQVEICIEGTLL